MKHTPTPYVLPEGYDTVGAIMGEIPIRASGDMHGAEIVAICKTKENRRKLSDNIVANAEFIVRACNAHDGLVEALQKCWDYICESAAQEDWMRCIPEALQKAKGNQ